MTIDKEKRRKYKKRWAKAHYDKEKRHEDHVKNRDRNIETARRWNEDHKDFVKQYQREYHNKLTPEQRQRKKTLAKKWRELHPGYFKEYYNERKLRETA